MHKKSAFLFLSGMMMFLLCACGNGTFRRLADVKLPPLPDFSLSGFSADEILQIEPSEEKAQVYYSENEEEHGNVLAVEFSGKKDEYYDPENGTVRILEYAVVSPRISSEEDSTPAEKINQYIALVDETFETGDDYGIGTSFSLDRTFALSQAEDHFTYIRSAGEQFPQESEVLFSVTRNSTVERNDHAVFSVLFQNLAVMQSTEKYEYAFSFSVLSGERLYMRDVFNDPQKISDLIYAKIDEEYPDFPETADMVQFSDEYDGITWCLTEEGALFLSNILGTQQKISIPYGELSGLIKEEYLI